MGDPARKTFWRLLLVLMLLSTALALVGSHVALPFLIEQPYLKHKD